VADTADPRAARETLGIVGLGRVGRHVAKIAHAFEMRVLAWSRRLTEEVALTAGAERRELDDVLRESDVISIHLTLAAESRGLISAQRIGLMKPTAYLINTARGPSWTRPPWSRRSPRERSRAPAWMCLTTSPAGGPPVDGTGERDSDTASGLAH